MKLIYTAFLALLFHSSYATTWIINVADFSFNSPNSGSTVNAVVGDIIQFNWVSGFHTTTCGSGLPGTTLPAGAAEWDNPMTSSNRTFSYTLTVPGTYLFGCVPHFNGGNGMKGNIIVSSVLPVKFGAFTVANITNKALLQWKTFSEVNTRYFSIRKSTDAANFYEIGRINAAGNSSLQQTYQFADNDLGEIYKYLYYEIITVGADGRESFSNIGSLKNNLILKDNLIVALSPNPITRPGQMQIKFNSDKSGKMDVSVFNASGQRVLRTRMEAFYGLNNAHLHVCDLQKGTYNIIFSMAGKKETKKIVVL